MSETAADWFNKAIALSDGKKFTDPHKAILYLSNAIKIQPNDAECITTGVLLTKILASTSLR
jgi:hypothetical protein